MVIESDPIAAPLPTVSQNIAQDRFAANDPTEDVNGCPSLPLIVINGKSGICFFKRRISHVGELCQSFWGISVKEQASRPGAGRIPPQAVGPMLPLLLGDIKSKSASLLFLAWQSRRSLLRLLQKQHGLS